MSLNESRVEQLRRDLARLREQAARASKTIADQRNTAAKHRAQPARSQMSQSHLRQADSAEQRALRAESERASIDTQIARKERDLYAAQAAVDRDRARAFDDLKRAHDLENRLQSLRRQPTLRRATTPLEGNQPPSEPGDRTATEWDFFVSHASPDKDTIARPLAEALRARGADVWFDEFELTVGDSLRRKIDEGLAESRFGIVVLTQAYLAGRQWTENELNGLFGANKRILPVWHNVSHDEVAAYSPMLADRVALVTAVLSLDRIVDELMSLLGSA